MSSRIPSPAEANASGMGPIRLWHPKDLSESVKLELPVDEVLPADEPTFDRYGAAHASVELTQKVSDVSLELWA